MREVIVKIELKQEEDEEEIVVKMLLDSDITGLVTSSEFVKKNKFKKKLKRLIYVRNMDSIFNYEGPIEYTVEVELLYRGHEKRTKINMI